MIYLPNLLRTLILFGISTVAFVAQAGTPGSYVGYSKSGQVFEFNMDGATFRNTADYDEEIPSYATVGQQVRRSNRMIEVLRPRPLPPICSHKVFKNGKQRLFTCGKGDHPMANATYRFTEERAGTRTYVCIAGCSNSIPATLSYSELE